MGDLRTTATPSRAPSPPRRLRARSLLMIRRRLRMLLRRLSSGSTRICLLKRRSLKRSKSLLRGLLCQSFSPWQELVAECLVLVVCQVECLELLVVCLTSPLVVECLVLLLLMILPLDLPLRKLTELSCLMDDHCRIVLVHTMIALLHTFFSID